MRKLQVLSVSLYDYTVRESMRKVEEYLKDGKVCTIAYLSKKGVMEADENEQIKEFLSKLDLTVPADSDILRAADVETRSRLREIDENDFMDEFLKKMVRQRKRVYFLAQTDADMKQLEECIGSYQANVHIVGRFVLDNLEADEDFVVNEINKAEPDVLISNTSPMKRIEFYEANHMKLNTHIWLMLKNDIFLHNRDKNIIKKLSDKIISRFFLKKVLRYNTEKDEK